MIKNEKDCEKNNLINNSDLNIFFRNIEDEMRVSYINYAMSVIIGRALPDVRDGLKPVHRRILYAMKEMGLKHNGAYKKSARIVGDVLGKYHPHGDSAVYNAMVRMVQNFSLRYPMIDGQGNFGSIDGDSAAAMRYTEVKMGQIAGEMLVDLEKNTVNFVQNYDGSLKEPSVLPTKLPNLLINGSSGIAVGMATNIPSHNICEICDALIKLIDNPDVSILDLKKIIKGPDFPTGAIILGEEGIKNYMENGRGTVKIRAKAIINETKNNKHIIINEIPYQVNKSSLINSIIDLIKNKKIDGISDLRDESGRDGIRILITVKKEANVQIVLNQLYKHTQLQISFGVIMLAIVDNMPKIMNIKEILSHYIEYRKIIVTKRTKFDLHKFENRAHILDGLRIAINNIESIIEIIKKANDDNSARISIISSFGLSKIQTDSILDTKIRQLTKLNVTEVEKEYINTIKKIDEFRLILSNPIKVLENIKHEIVYIKKEYGDKRKTEIQTSISNFNIEDLIQNEKVVITMSNTGYIKRISLDIYKSQNRGGRGITAMSTKEEDFVEDLFIANSHAYIMFFTNFGKVYKMRVYEIPEGSRISRGKPIVNLLQLQNNKEKITSFITIKNFNDKNECFLLCTKNGIIKKISVSEFINVRKCGIIAIKLNYGDVLIGVKIIKVSHEIIIATKKGIAIRFNEKDVRKIGRNTKGVKGIVLDKNDEVVGIEVLLFDDVFVSVSENGYGKRTFVGKYRLQRRAGRGVINMQTTIRNGNIVGVREANENKEIMIMTKNGVTIRIKSKDIPIIGRNTQGVKLVKLDVGDKVSSIACVLVDKEEL
jgi:DNA gyrase subunit A